MLMQKKSLEIFYHFKTATFLIYYMVSSLINYISMLNLFCFIFMQVSSPKLIRLPTKNLNLEIHVSQWDFVI